MVFNLPGGIDLSFAVLALPDRLVEGQEGSGRGKGVNCHQHFIWAGGRQEGAPAYFGRYSMVVAADDGLVGWQHC